MCIDAIDGSDKIFYATGRLKSEMVIKCAHMRIPILVSRTVLFFFFQAEDGIRDVAVTGVQTCALPISFWHWTTMPVGRWVMRTAESAVLTPWPPGPEDRKTSTRISSSRTLTSTSSTSGTTEADAKLVCRRREASNGEIRTSRCTQIGRAHA